MMIAVLSLSRMKIPEQQHSQHSNNRSGAGNLLFLSAFHQTSIGGRHALVCVSAWISTAAAAYGNDENFFFHTSID